MTGSNRRLIWVMVMVLAVVGCSATSGGQPMTTTTEVAVQPIPDGSWFAFLTVGQDERGAMTMGVDVAEMLTGEEARQAAVEEGIIAEDEELPNDFFVANDEEVLELVDVAPDARFLLISGTDTSKRIEVDAQVLAEVYAGTYSGEPIYGIAPSMPIAMDVAISDGLIKGGEAVYLP